MLKDWFLLDDSWRVFLRTGDPPGYYYTSDTFESEEAAQEFAYEVRGIVWPWWLDAVLVRRAADGFPQEGPALRAPMSSEFMRSFIKERGVTERENPHDPSCVLEHIFPSGRVMVFVIPNGIDGQDVAAVLEELKESFAGKKP